MHTISNVFRCCRQSNRDTETAAVERSVNPEKNTRHLHRTVRYHPPRGKLSDPPKDTCQTATDKRKLSDRKPSQHLPLQYSNNPFPEYLAFRQDPQAFFPGNHSLQKQGAVPDSNDVDPNLNG